MTGLTAELRSEIEQILRHSSPGLTHGELFRYMEQGLSEEEMLERHGTSPSNIRNFMRSLDHLLNGTLPETKSAARVNSMVYKELLNHGLSPELLSYVKSRLRRLMDINADITMAPLRTRSHRYPTKSPRKAPPESLCPLCHLAKPCDCD